MSFTLGALLPLLAILLPPPAWRVPVTVVAVLVALGLTGAVSMALGEYVSVSTQRDSEHALLAKEKQELQETPSRNSRS